MSQPFLGEIKQVGYTFAPVDWAECNGQLITISDNAALFSLLGDAYGGKCQNLVWHSLAKRKSTDTHG